MGKWQITQWTQDRFDEVNNLCKKLNYDPPEVDDLISMALSTQFPYITMTTKHIYVGTSIAAEYIEEPMQTHSSDENAERR